MEPLSNPKSQVFMVSTSSDVGPWAKLQLQLSSTHQIKALSLLELAAWRPASNTAIHAFLVDLDDLGDGETARETIDVWALKAWRATFNDLVARCAQPGQNIPLLMGFTRKASWETAQIGVLIGARELFTLDEIPARLGQKPTAEIPEAPFAFASASDPKTQPTPKLKISRNMIPFPIEGLDGTSAAVESLRNLVRKMAPMDMPVHISGPTGSGKERVARSLHRYSGRASSPFEALNCGALSVDLAESELFGHVKGAFTSAVDDRKGFFQRAHGGTLFLDDITELAPSLQVKLLRVLSDKRVTPLGSETSTPIDVRLLSSSRMGLDEAISANHFREDLAYRIRVLEIQLPSLSERRTDLPEFSRIIINRLARENRKSTLDISSEVMEKFLLYRWPGNIRELENALSHACALCWSDNRTQINLRDLPDNMSRAEMILQGDEHHLKEAVRRFEKEYIAQAIRRLGGSKEDAADQLGLSLATLYRKIA